MVGTDLYENIRGYASLIDANDWNFYTERVKAGTSGFFKKVTVMKIAVIDPSLFTLPYDAALIDALRGQGHDVSLYTKFLTQKEGKHGLPYIKEVFYPGFQLSFMQTLPKPLFLGLKGIAHVFGLLTLWLMLYIQKPDIIHFQWVPLPAVDRMFLPLFRRIAPAILTVHDSSPFNNNPRARIQGVGAIGIMKDFDHLIVHTNKAKDVLIARGIDLNRISKIDHGVLGVSMPANRLSGSTYEKKSGPVTILLFGHLKPYKGPDILISALSKISADARKNVRLRIAGKPQMDTEPLFELARREGVSDMIDWDLRFIDDSEVGALFAQSDITVMPYREIDASGVLMVALSIGKPIVATRIGLFKELLEEGTHALLVPMEDPAALAAALETLVNDPVFREEMGNNVRNLGQSIPSWNAIAQTTTTLYHDLTKLFR